MYNLLYTILDAAVIITMIIVAAAYIKESTAYKLSNYGKQHKMSFWKVLNNKGMIGEYRTSRVLEKAPFECRYLYNCYIPLSFQIENKTELDMVMISAKGIYVIENKNYSGWIFGDERSQKWCQVLGKKKFFFYNPIQQNRNHIKNLEAFLEVGADKYVSVVIFNTNDGLKKINVESDKTFVLRHKEVKNFINIQQEKEDCLSHEEIEDIYDRLLPGTQLSDEEKRIHIKRLQQKYKKN